MGKEGKKNIKEQNFLWENETISRFYKLSLVSDFLNFIFKKK